MLRLYYAPGTCALASHIALEEAGADYEAVRVDFTSEEQRKPAYLAINPKGRVPALATEDGIFSETPAILAYVAQVYPAARLAPLDRPFEFARLQAFNAYLCATLPVAHAHGRRGSRWADRPESHEDMKQKVPESVGACFELIEREMFAGPWVMGDAYSIADPYLFTMALWMEGDGVDPARYPKIADHRRRMSERPAVAEARAAEAA